MHGHGLGSPQSEGEDEWLIEWRGIELPAPDWVVEIAAVPRRTFWLIFVLSFTASLLVVFGALLIGFYLAYH